MIIGSSAALATYDVAQEILSVQSKALQELRSVHANMRTSSLISRPPEHTERLRFTLPLLSLDTSQCSHASQPRVLGGQLIEAPKARVGSWVVLSTHWNDLRSTYVVSGLLRLPYMLARYAVAVEAVFHLSALHWPCMSHTLSVKSIIPHDSRFLRACANGDLSAVRDLAVARQGHPTDVDETGRPVLHVRLLH